VRADHVDPWRVSPAVALPDGLGLTSAGTLTFGSDGARGPLEWLAARAYDPSTYGFLATDPVPPVIGAGWAANAYSYAGNNPLAFSDPTGLHPLNDAEFHQRTQGWLAGAWDAAKDWATTGWGGWALGAVMVVGGGVMMATGFGGPVGAMLLSAGADTLIQKATTGKVDYKEVGVTGLLGGVGDFGVAAKLGLTGVKAAATSGAIAGGVSGGALNVFYYASEPGPVTAGGIAAHFGEGVAVGSVTGAASSGISSAVGDKIDSVATSKLHLGEGGYEPKHAYVPKHAAPPAHPTSTGGRLAGAAAAHVNAGAWSLVNDRANGDADPSGPLRSGLVGTVMGSPQGTYHPAHAAR
jgi:RHS repeat-associated protein